MGTNVSAEGSDITYTTSGASVNTDSITEAIAAVNAAGSGTIRLNSNIAYTGTGNIDVTGNLTLDLNGHNIAFSDSHFDDYQSVCFAFKSCTSSIIGSGTITSISAIDDTSKATSVIVNDRATLTIGTQNASAYPTIYGFEVTGNAGNKLTVYGGDFYAEDGSITGLLTDQENGIRILGGTFFGDVTVGNAYIRGAVFNDVLAKEFDGTDLVIDDCDCLYLD